jgi:hypothetical protein
MHAVTCFPPVLALPEERLFTIIFNPAVHIPKLVIPTKHKELVRIFNLQGQAEVQS